MLSTSPVGAVDRAQLEVACRAFVGRIKQVPPMYSAVHHQGQRLYELARQGIEVAREPREVVIHALDVEEVAGESVRLSIVCGKGTYIRALAADLGAALGCGAAVERLVRTRVGPFALDDATPWDVLSTAPAPTLWARVQPAAATLAGWAAQCVSTPDPPSGSSTVRRRRWRRAGVADGTLVRVHAADGRMLGVGEVALGGRQTRPVRILHADRPGPRVLPA